MRAAPLVPLVVLVGAVTGVWSSTARAQTASQAQTADNKIFEGVYTAAQAERGKTIYVAYCTRCHGLDLNGGRQGGQGAPALSGNPFFVNWERSSLNNLLSKIERTMPQDSPASLRADDYVDVATYILQANAFPSGSAELKRDASLTENIYISRKANAQTEAPSFALVQVVGCLTQGPNNTWMLTSSSDPMVTKDEGVSASELKEAQGIALGSQSFRLLDAAHFNPQQHKGHKVEAKGLLNRAPENRIDVLSLQMVGAICAN